MIRIGLTVAVMAMGGFGLLTATADARSHGCRYSSAGQAPAIKNLRVSGGPCFAAELTADNIIATFNGNGGRLPHRPRGSSYRCHYRKTSLPATGEPAATSDPAAGLSP